METKMGHTQQAPRNGFRPAARQVGQYNLTPQSTGKIIDWEAFHYGMLDHKFLNDPNPAVADHRHTIYELWVGELVGLVMAGEIPVYSKDGQLPRRLADADRAGTHNADTLIGCLFETSKLLQNMDDFFNRHRELH